MDISSSSFRAKNEVKKWAEIQGFDQDLEKMTFRYPRIFYGKIHLEYP